MVRSFDLRRAFGWLVIRWRRERQGTGRRLGGTTCRGLAIGGFLKRKWASK